MKLFKTMYKRTKAAKLAIGTALMTMGSSAMAALPTAPVSTNTNTGGSTYLGPIQNYLMDGIVLLGILVGTYAFFRVAQNAIQTYGEISDGNGTYRDLAGSVIAGVVIASGVVWLLTNAMSMMA
jgi:integrating conjugative element membrane protein (TIGR03745 family)